jgi:hypothetical protein
MLTLAAQILKRKVAEFGPKAFRDRYEEALLARLKTKRVGAVREEGLRFAAPRRVTNLMEALRQGIAQDQKPAARRPASGREYREHDDDLATIMNHADLVLNDFGTFGHADRETEPPQADRQTKIGLCPAVERAR